MEILIAMMSGNTFHYFDVNVEVGVGVFVVVSTLVRHEVKLFKQIVVGKTNKIKEKGENNLSQWHFSP